MKRWRELVFKYGKDFRRISAELGTKNEKKCAIKMYNM